MTRKTYRENVGSPIEADVELTKRQTFADVRATLAASRERAAS